MKARIGQHCRNLLGRLYELATPAAGRSGERFSTSLCKFLQSRAEIDACTEFLHHNGYTSHNVSCKDWDLALILPEITSGNFLDMGSSDSYVLKNLARKKTDGHRYGIDLRLPDVPVRGVRYVVGDLMESGLPSEFFHHITCLSVIEHEVDFSRFAREASRLLAPAGQLFVTFDYWEPRRIAPIRMYGLNWQPLDRLAVENLIAEAGRHGLILAEEMNWNLGDAVICDGYYSPHPSMSYTFGMVVFTKV